MPSKDSLQKYKRFVNNCDRNIGLFNLLIYFMIFSLSTSWKVSFDLFDFLSQFSSGAFYITKLPYKLDLIFKIGIKVLIYWNFQVFYYIWEEIMQHFSCFRLAVNYFSIFDEMNFVTFIDLSDRKGLTVFPKFLLSVKSVSFKSFIVI